MNEEIQRHFERRQQADYEAILRIDRETTKHLLEEAVDFVDACRRLTPRREDAEESE